MNSTSDQAAANTSTLPERKHRIFVVDDHPIFRRGMAAIINEEPDLEVVGQASSAAQALQLLRQMEVDVVVIDVSLPGANGVELLKYIRAEKPKLAILVLSAHDEQIYGLRCLRAGASGYLMKTGAAENLAGALRKVIRGGVSVSSSFSEQLIYRVAQRSDDTATHSPLDALSDRELEVLQHVGAGRSSREIAEALFLSVKTVESHRLHIKEKLGLPDARQLVRFAVDWVAQQG